MASGGSQPDLANTIPCIPSYQENLKYVRDGQPIEVALDPYPGQIFKGTVSQIWRANAAGQSLPSDVLPGFDAADPHQALGQFAVQNPSL